MIKPVVLVLNDFLELPENGANKISLITAHEMGSLMGIFLIKQKINKLYKAFKLGN